MSQKIALVTGAGSGIGRAVAFKLASNGFTVVLAGRTQARLNEVAAKIGSGALAVATDVTDPPSVIALFDTIRAKFGRLDVLFNNAGVSVAAQPLDALRLEDWHTVMDTNVTGVFMCTQAAFALMKEQRPQGGRIINNGSISATTPRPHLIAYTAAKHAVSGLTKTTALEGRQFDIACGQIDIGNTATDMAAAMTSGTLQADLTIKPEPTFDVTHAADAVLYMANLPLTTNVLSMTVIATKMPFVGRG
jgi:NAD(P)-dependent dehydrogenase (short-subunit alcohol dehydrogenase family)